MDFGKLDFNAAVKEELSREFEAGSLSHAVLITGKNNEMRKKLARQLAAAFLCSSNTVRPCKSCPACLKAKSNIHPDIIETEGTDKSKSIKIDAIREIRRQAYIIPNEADCKIFIILEAGGMGDEAQNALLKIIEEPPRFTRFILACASKEMLLPTIQSRIAHFNIGEADADKITAKTQEKINSLCYQVAKSLTSGKEFDLIISTSPLEKDRALFKKCVDELVLILRDAMRGETAPPLSQNPEAALLIAKKYGMAEIFAMIEKLKILSDDAIKNANENLLLSRLASALFDI